MIKLTNKATIKSKKAPARFGALHNVAGVDRRRIHLIAKRVKPSPPRQVSDCFLYLASLVRSEDFVFVWDEQKISIYIYIYIHEEIDKKKPRLVAIPSYHMLDH